uniref:Uncharacterized protein n=1 Tax=Sparus aurata TaxID=8175 RepID=A0A671X5W7_SPAAU
MPKAERKAKKHIITQCEVEYHLVDTVLGRVTNARKWSDIKVEVKKRLASHRQSVCATGEGTGQLELTPLNKKLAGIIGESHLSGVVTEVEGDTDAGPQEAEDPVTLFKTFLVIAAGPSEVSGAAAEPCAPSISTAPRPSQPSSGHVLTDAVLQMQRDTITAIKEVAKELREIKNVLTDLNTAMKVPMPTTLVKSSLPALCPLIMEIINSSLESGIVPSTFSFSHPHPQEARSGPR